MATRTAKRHQRPDIRSEARSASVLLRMSMMERRLLHRAAKDRGLSVQELVMEIIRPTLTATLRQEQLDLGIEDRELIDALNP
jgi:uncharacterized protein (DUF1778 family)